MYYVPNGYPYSYYPHLNQPTYHFHDMSRNYNEKTESVNEVVLNNIKKNASAITLYRQLADCAPDDHHKKNIHYLLERKKATLPQWINLYGSLTGKQPVYETNKIAIHNYKDGLDQAIKLEEASYGQMQRSSLLPQHPQIHSVVLKALHDGKDDVIRLQAMKNELLHRVTDYGSSPFVVDMEEATKQNHTFRTALWTGKHLQLTLMNIEVGEDIGLEVHPDVDQFLRIEQGQGIVQMGDRQDHLYYQEEVFEDYAIFVPAGTWHNLTNTGHTPIKLYTIYAPPEHPFGTVHETKAIAMAAEEHHHH